MLLVDFRQTIESVVQRSQIDVLLLDCEPDGFVQRHLHGIPATFFAMFSARTIDENVTHDLSGEGKELRAAFPLKACLADEANIGFVDQRRRLQRLVPALVS